MRRLAVIVALGALLGVLGGVVTASPALARGARWQVLPAAPFTLPALFCGFRVRVAFPADTEYAKVLKAADGSITTLATGSLTMSATNLATGKTITENISGPAKDTVACRRLGDRAGEGPQWARPDASRRGALRAAHPERDRGRPVGLDRPRWQHHLTVPA